MDIGTFLGKINDAIINPTITVLFAVAFIVFFWGLVGVIRNSQEGGDIEKSKRHVVWGIVGLVIMFGVLGIISLILDTTGIPAPNNVPFDL